MYEYDAHVIRVIDGDTVELEIDLGMDIRVVMMTRLLGINAPEIHNPDGSGKTARDWMFQLIFNKEIGVKTVKDHKEKYGRYLATLYMVSDTGEWLEPSVNQQMIDSGHAVFYDGGKRV